MAATVSGVNTIYVLQSKRIINTVNSKKPTLFTCLSSKQNTGNLTSDFTSTPKNGNGAEPSKKTQSASSENPTYSRGLVLDLGSEASWDSAEIGSPVIKRYLSDDEERWYMWYHGSSITNPGEDSIGLAVSGNGIHWERGVGCVRSSGDVGLVMKCSQDWWGFDTKSIRPCEVIIMSSSKVKSNGGVYWLYYTGFSSEEVEFSEDSLGFRLDNPERGVRLGGGKILRSLGGLAMSQDGRHWARIEGEHHSGALFDVESDSLFVSSPQVVVHGDRDLRMYYHVFDVEKGKFSVGLARSRDGLKWVKLGKIVLGGGGSGGFDECGVANARVVRNKRDGTYVMAYEGVAADGGRSIGLALSSDGLKGWERLQDVPVLERSGEEGWDCEGVGAPCLVEMDGGGEEAEGWRLYYRGVGRVGRSGIGMAAAPGDDFLSFRRCSALHL